MITLKDAQINSLTLYYTEELIALKAEAVRQAEKMHAARGKSYSIGTMPVQDADTDGAIVKIIYSRTRIGNKYIIKDRRAA